LNLFFKRNTTCLQMIMKIKRKKAFQRFQTKVIIDTKPWKRKLITQLNATNSDMAIKMSVVQKVKRTIFWWLIRKLWYVYKYFVIQQLWEMSLANLTLSKRLNLWMLFRWLFWRHSFPKSAFTTIQKKILYAKFFVESYY